MSEEGGDSSGLLIGVAVLCFCSMFVAIVYLYLQTQKKTPVADSPAEDDWEIDPNSMVGQQMIASLNANANTKPCQTLSDVHGSYGDYKGTIGLDDWSGFRVRQCTTKPAALTANTVLIGQISGKQIGFTSKDPLLKESGSISTGGFMANPVANKHFVVGTSKACIFPGINTASDSTQTAGWCTSPGTDSKSAYKFGFDTATANAGNLCLFNKTDTTSPPAWCALPQITLQTTSTTTGLADIQQQQRATAKMKNRLDTDTRYAIMRDDGKLCMYKGTPSTPGENLWCSS